MSAVLVLVVVFSAVALGLSAFSLWVSWGARRDARQAYDAARQIAKHLRKRPPVEHEPRVERREEDAGPPEGEPERRRHRAPETVRYTRLRASADARERGQVEPAAPASDDATTHLPVVQPETAEHPPPTSTYRRPPPPLPRPGAIGRPQ